MKIIRREFRKVSRLDEFRLIPIGDIHLGAGGCDEDLLKSVVNRIASEDNTYWIGLGDYCDFINMSDKRFDVSTFAPWITVLSLKDLVKSQEERFLDYVLPVAKKCLGLVKGNHEDTIHKKYERDIFSDIVTKIKSAAKMPEAEPLSLDYYGWLKLVFYRGRASEAVSTIVGNLHHGFTGGRMAGAKALNMQRWLWTHDCDFALFGHSHNTMAQVESVETLDRGDRVTYQIRRGGYAGTFLRSTNEDMDSGYSERKGYLPLPVGGCELILKPGALQQRDRVRIVT